MDSQPDNNQHAALTAFLSACSGNLLAILNVGTLWLEPPGTSFRPIHLPLFALIIAGSTLFMTIPFSYIAYRSQRHRLLTLLAVLLSLGPIPLTVILTRWTVVVRDLTFQP